MLWAGTIECSIGSPSPRCELTLDRKPFLILVQLCNEPYAKTRHWDMCRELISWNSVLRVYVSQGQIISISKIVEILVERVNGTYPTRILVGTV